MSAILSDAATPDFDLSGEDDSGVNDFLKSFLPPDAQKKKEPSEGTPESKEEETPDEKTEEADANSDESPEEAEANEETSEKDEKAEERKFAEDATFVKIKVDGKEHDVPVKDLSRLWGQEAALTQKSQQVAEQRTRAEYELTQNVAATNALLERARMRFEPYSKIDFLLAAQQLNPEEYTALRNEAAKAHEDVQFLEQHLGAFMQHINNTQQHSLRTRAAETLRELGSDDPDRSIPGWNEKTYDELRVFATTKLGVPPDVMNNLVDAWSIRVLHKAMLYEKSKSNNVVTQKVNKTPKKVIKTTTTPEANKSSSATGSEKAMKRLRSSGTTDDAADAFLARWDDDN